MGRRGRETRLGPLARAPAIVAVPLWGAARGEEMQLLTAEERASLSVIGSIVRFAKGALIYREGAPADAVFNIVDGVAKVYATVPEGSRRISAFLFAGDLLGLAREGRYVSSAVAVTQVTAYRLPVAAVEARLRKDATLGFHVISKLCHDLREAQRHAVLVGRRTALAKVAAFLQMLDGRRAAHGGNAGALGLPMTRSDIADYAGLSLEAVSRAFRTLTSRGIIRLADKRSLVILDRARLDALADDDPAPEPAGRRARRGASRPRRA